MAPVAVANSSRLARAAELVLVLSAAAAGLTWALPAAAIGLTLGFVVLGTLYFPRTYVPYAAVLAVVACCAAVAYLDAMRDLGIGYRYIPAVLPSLLLSLTFSSIVHRSSRHGDRPQWLIRTRRERRGDSTQ